MKAVKFKAHCGKYQVGEIAGFSENVAETLVEMLYADYVNPDEALDSDENGSETESLSVKELAYEDDFHGSRIRKRLSSLLSKEDGTDG